MLGRITRIGHHVSSVASRCTQRSPLTSTSFFRNLSQSKATANHKIQRVKEHIDKVAGDGNGYVTAESIKSKFIARQVHPTMARIAGIAFMKLVNVINKTHVDRISSLELANLSHLDTRIFDDPTVFEKLATDYTQLINGKHVLFQSDIYKFIYANITKSSEWKQASLHEKAKGLTALYVEWIKGIYKSSLKKGESSPNPRALIFSQWSRPYASIDKVAELLGTEFTTQLQNINKRSP